LHIKKTKIYRFVRVVMYRFITTVPVAFYWPSFEPFWSLLVDMRRNGHTTISGVKFDLRYEFCVPDFLNGENCWKMQEWKGQ